MTTRRVVKSVLNNFLGTYTSRYSDYRGYWLHGQLPLDLQEWTIDLLGAASEREGVKEVAHRLAIRRFAEQLSMSGLTFDMVREATLRFTKDPNLIKGWQGDYIAAGHMVQFVARAVMDNGRVYVNEQQIFVAPHDPGKESQRNEADWGT